MAVVIGIRREDKNEWERRVPLIPADVAELNRDHGLQFVVQPSPIRVFPDEEYRTAGAVVQEDLSGADIILAVKEIPLSLLQPGKVHLFFSHTVKGQSYNMPLLQGLLDRKATLIDYERISDEQNRRLIFFSVHAGYAGTLETLRAWGLRRRAEGVETPLAQILPAYEYPDLEAAKKHMLEIGASIARDGMGEHTGTVIIGIAGYGNVSRGCQEILDCLPVIPLEVADLPAAAAARPGTLGPLAMVIFHEEDMVEPRASEAQFVLQDYYRHPENYRGVFSGHLPHLDILLNTIYWESRYPRLVTRKWARGAWGQDEPPRLRVIGDISCDIEGGVELTLKATMPDAPCFVVDPDRMEPVMGYAGRGPTIMSVDNLPCELPRESSLSFSAALKDMVADLARTEFQTGFESLMLPSYLKKAVITHRGELTPGYRYLQEFLDRAGR